MHTDKNHPNATDAREDCCEAQTLQTTESSVEKHGISSESNGLVHVSRYHIDKMDCPAEERLIRNKLEPVAGVVRLDFDLLERVLTIHHEPVASGVFESSLTAIGMAPVKLDELKKAPELPSGMLLQEKVLLGIGGVAAL